MTRDDSQSRWDARSVYDAAVALRSREKTSWHGEYLGVTWEIQRFESVLKYRRKFDWTFYLHISIDRIPKESNPEGYWLEPRLDRKRVYHDYYRSPLADIEWHGEITYYSKEAGHEGGPRYIKAGCDFQHAWDFEHGEQSLDWVKIEVVKAIRSFRDLVPGYGYWCRWDGKTHTPAEVVVVDGNYDCECSKKEAIKAAALRGKEAGR